MSGPFIVTVICAGEAGALDRALAVLTPVERRLGVAMSAPRRLGRLAAKLAVARLLGYAEPADRVLRNIEVLPTRDALCTRPRWCERGHPTVARLVDDDAPAGFRRPVGVSISHDRQLAVAVAFRLPSPPDKSEQPSAAETEGVVHE